MFNRSEYSYVFRRERKVAKPGETAAATLPLVRWGERKMPLGKPASSKVCCLERDKGNPNLEVGFLGVCHLLVNQRIRQQDRKPIPQGIGRRILQGLLVWDEGCHRLSNTRAASESRENGGCGKPCHKGISESLGWTDFAEIPRGKCHPTSCTRKRCTVMRETPPGA